MNKKLLALAATGLLYATGVSAHDFEVDGIYYNITSAEDKTVEVTYEGSSVYSANYSGSVTIPEIVTYNENTYSVNGIGSAAFYHCSGLTSVVIPNSVTSIGYSAFSECSLTSVAIPNSVTNIGELAFCRCAALTSVAIPNSVTSIGESAFAGCSLLTSIIVAEDNSTFDSRDNCNAIIETQTNTLIAGCSNTTIPNSVTSIGTHAFSRCSSLTSVEIPNSVTSIGDYAFYECSSLTSVEIPNSVTSIGLSAFSGTALYNNQPDGVVYLDTYLLGYKGTMPSNTSIKIKEGTLQIANFAFSWCSSLTSVEIPNSVTSIGSNAFNGCDGLTSVEIPNSVTSIGDEVFSYCYNLSSITVAENNPIYDSRDNCNAIIETQTNTLIVGCSKTTIPNSVTSIESSAFSGCLGLTSVTIPGSITTIEWHTFSGCSNLTSVYIQDGVKSIDVGAFQNCEKLENVELPASVTSIGGSAFADCENLELIQVAPENEIYCSFNSNGIWGVYSKDMSELIAVPGGATGEFVIPETVKSVNYGACDGCKNLTSVVIPASVSHIGEYAFADCEGMTLITSNIPADKLFSISTNVFQIVNKANCFLNVPCGAQATYAATEGWGGFKIIPYELTISDAGYATLYLDYTAQIPEGVSVYTANEVEGNLLKMELVEGLLPANTGVVVKAPAGTYTFTYSDTYAPEISDNLFKGSATYEYVDVASTQTAFVLSKVDGEVGMYPAKLTDGRFLNNANKAYLLLTTKLGVSDEELDTSVGGSQLSLRFDFGGTTSVDKVQTESGADAVIYDLYGRKVNKATTPGFYIINNKKVWVK